jgi:hypothetical protein
MIETAERVDRLEALLGSFIVNTETAILRLERGLESFKNDMRVFKDEMLEFKDEMLKFKDEMSEFKDRMDKSSIKWEEDIRKANQQAGELSRKFGTLVEDMVLPSFPKALKDKFGLEIDAEYLYPRVKKKHPETNLTKEYDAFIISGDLLFLNSTKTRLNTQYIDEFIKDIELFREYFPIFKDKKIIGVLATLYPDENIIKYAEKTGFLVLGLGDWLMELKNSKDFKPKEW